MKIGPQVKVCGITDPGDGSLAVELGADFLGFIFYPKSPRCLDWDGFLQLRDELPPAQRVYVQVRPEPAELRRALSEGFDFFQLHFEAGEEAGLIEAWAETVGADRLWLAPKIAPGQDFPAPLLAHAGTFLIDTYRKGSFGGTGETGDWERFRGWSEARPDKRWVLAGGLAPENIQAALRESGASLVDVSSCIEERPGKKSHSRMREFFAAIDLSR
jgi:phosphoribosylanthranilate isomerase